MPWQGSLLGDSCCQLESFASYGDLCNFWQYLIGKQSSFSDLPRAASRRTVEDRKSSDGFEDDEGDRPGPNFKIGCRRKLRRAKMSFDVALPDNS